MANKRKIIVAFFMVFALIFSVIPNTFANATSTDITEDGRVSWNISGILALSGSLVTQMIFKENTLTIFYFSAILSANLISIENSEIQQPEDEFYENEKGWLVGEGLDGRRIRVIFRNSDMPTISSASGEEYFIIGDVVYTSETMADDTYIGDCWQLGDGYQFELLNGDYNLEFISDKDTGATIEISYMNNGYFERQEIYNAEKAENTYTLSVAEHSSPDVKLMDAEGLSVEPVSVASVEELVELNIN